MLLCGQIPIREYRYTRIHMRTHLSSTSFGKISYLFDVLKAINNEAFDRDAAKHLVVVDHDRLDCVEALYFRQQDEGIQVVVSEDQLLQLRELPKFLEVRVVDD